MNTSDKHLRILATATLIRRFQEHCPLSELYEKAIRSYETLLDVIENSSTAKSIGEILHIPDSAIKKHAESIITILLNNKENNLFLAFGLKNNAPLSAVKKRWKRLICIYHPDKLSHPSTMPDKTIAINIIYDNLKKLLRKNMPTKINHMSGALSIQTQRRSYIGNTARRNLSLITAILLLIVICAILLLLFK